jgi:hypothetical protein
MLPCHPPLATRTPRLALLTLLVLLVLLLIPVSLVPAFTVSLLLLFFRPAGRRGSDGGESFAVFAQRLSSGVLGGSRKFCSEEREGPGG